MIGTAYRVNTFCPHVPGGTGGLSVAGDGRVFASDFGAILGDRASMGRKIFVVDESGSVEVFATGFQGASGSVFDEHGNLFQANIRGNCISKVSPDGNVVIYAEEGIEGPVGVTLGPDGELFVANCGNNTIQVVTPDGRSRRFAADPLLNGPNGITMDRAGNLYVANFENGDVLRIYESGTVELLATLPGGNNGHLLFADGHLYVVDRGAHQIRIVSLEGESQVFAGSGVRGNRDGPPDQAEFSYPNDIIASRDGRSFFVNEIASIGGDSRLLSPMRIRTISEEAT